MRDDKGRFIKGVSGNPQGQPTRAAHLRRLLADGADEAAHAVLEAAKGGDMAAARLVLERLVPPVRPSHQPVRFELDADKPLADQGRAVLSAIAAGAIPPDQGKALLDAIAALVQVVKVDELAHRMTALEEQSNG